MKLTYRGILLDVCAVDKIEEDSTMNILSPAIVPENVRKRAVEIRVKELVRITLEAARRDWNRAIEANTEAPDFDKATANRVEQLVLEIAEGRTHLKPNDQEIDQARKEIADADRANPQ